MRTKIQEAWQACQYDNINVLKELVPSQVPPDASTFDPSNHVHTLLMCAAAHGSVECCKYLVEQNATIGLKNFSGYTAIHWAAFTGREECLQILLAGRDKNSSSNKDKKNKGEVKTLLESQTDDGKTPLHIAAFRGHLDFIEVLVTYGADISAVSSNGWTALHYALTSNQKIVCEYLLSKKIDARAPDSFGKDVFDIATQYERTWFQDLAKKHKVVTK